MTRLTLDQLRGILPDSEILRPVLDRALALAAPDPRRTWSSAGEVGTLGQRVLDVGVLAKELDSIVARVEDHLTQVLTVALKGVEAAAAERWADAVGAFLEAARMEGEAGRLPQGWAFVESALSFRTRVPDQRVVIPALLAGARLQRQMGGYTMAESLYRQTAELSAHAGNPQWSARAWTGLGNLAVDRAKWNLALEHYTRAEAFLGPGEGSLPEEWHLPLNRSIVARRQGDVERAGHELDEARRRSLAFDEPDRDAILWNAEAQLREARNELATAEEAYRLGLEAAASSHAQATIGLNLAQLLLRFHRTLEAGELARQAEHQVLRSGVLTRLPEVYRVLGQVASQESTAEPLPFFEQALEVVRSWDLPEVERARTLEAYGGWEAAHGARELGEARLKEARFLFERLDCHPDAERVAQLIEAMNATPSPGNPGNTEESRP